MSRGRAQDFRAPGLPFTGATEATRATSQGAAQAKQGTAAEDRRRILAMLEDWPQGATDEEIQQELGMHGDSERPRRIELARAGMITGIGTRRTRAGRPAVVWYYRHGLYTS